jgi:hypothetical protein
MVSLNKNVINIPKRKWNGCQDLHSRIKSGQPRRFRNLNAAGWTPAFTGGMS